MENLSILTSPSVGVGTEVTKNKANSLSFSSTSPSEKNSTNIRIRPMTLQDIDSCTYDIQKAVFPEDLQESTIPYLHRFNSYPAGCFIAEKLKISSSLISDTPTLQYEIVGYGQSHPWIGDHHPNVNVPEDQLEPIPSHGTPSEGYYYFLFDISTKLKRQGIGELLYTTILQHIIEKGYKEIRLVAVRGAHTYWARYGFEILHIIPPNHGYGNEPAIFMRKYLE